MKKMADLILTESIMFTIISIGLLGNSIAIFIFLRKRFIKLLARNIYLSMLIFDNIKLISYLVIGTSISLNHDLRVVSEFSCKLIAYIQTSLTAICAWLTAYSSFDKFISIKYKHFQINKNLVILFIISFNLIYSVSYPFFSEITLIRNQSNQTFSDCVHNDIFFSLEMAFSFVLPFIIMIIFTTLLLYTIIESRCRIAQSGSQQNRNRLKKDIKFAVTICLINISYIALDLPFYTLHILRLKDDIVLNFQILTFCMNFFILVISNSIFYQEFLKIFLCRKNLNNNSSLQMNSLNN